MPTPRPADLSVVQLRERAMRLIEMADRFLDDKMSQLLREQAAELDAQANALERKG
jgi:hypothetical protein